VGVAAHLGNQREVGLERLDSLLDYGVDMERAWDVDRDARSMIHE
jgi:hypothetical protein